MNKQTPLEQVNHEFSYHCEIHYESEHAFGYTRAVGNSIQDLLDDIYLRFKQYRDREPQIVEVLYLPKTEKINITPKIRALISMKPAHQSQK